MQLRSGVRVCAGDRLGSIFPTYFLILFPSIFSDRMWFALPDSMAWILEVGLIKDLPKESY